MVFIAVFFFSSRRRHTRWPRDWSSDVCSSDLHHLNAMDARALITRRRDPANRRVHLVEMTPDGEAAFHRLREAAGAFDRRLRGGIGSDELATFDRMLDR